MNTHKGQAEDACVRDLREALCRAKREGIEVELLTAAPPPAGRPPNIRGVVVEVKKGIIKLALTSGPPDRVAVFSICQIIGFVPFEEDEELLQPQEELKSVDSAELFTDCQ